ncbi:MAG: imidazole glycerol phosphate synthase subunit HisH [Thermoanaerobaculia bacterium]
MEVTLVDSPVANTANIARALRAAGAGVLLTSDANIIAGASKIVLPGVGSFRAAMSWLTSHSLDAALRDAVSRGALLLGICVGHQLLFESSDEMGDTAGIGLLRGRVRKLESTLPVPQIGWNRVRFAPNALFEGVPSDTPFYFVNSYAASGAEAEIASASYGTPFTAAVRERGVFGVQFHPEKSSTAGLRVLRNFVERVQ